MFKFNTNVLNPFDDDIEEGKPRDEADEFSYEAVKIGVNIIIKLTILNRSIFY